MAARAAEAGAAGARRQGSAAGVVVPAPAAAVVPAAGAVVAVPAAGWVVVAAGVPARAGSALRLLVRRARTAPAVLGAPGPGQAAAAPGSVALLADAWAAPADG
ncbi:hypothetical protein MKUB_31820 [Mycobacterium kubicae]|uniref:Uncharacterized protein n=1 Tax=Mycobacterium kubicae TaxID=120959 RepID=A0ABQ1BPQ5_9MYCO|nr:hypothetical protein MKUB_31820 [Mycobacterium kubicae]